MLEKPDLPDELILTVLNNEYGLAGVTVAFLPIGADFNTAIYAVDGSDGTAYFLKLRSGPFDVISVTLPKFLNDHLTS